MRQIGAGLIALGLPGGLVLAAFVAGLLGLVGWPSPAGSGLRLILVDCSRSAWPHDEEAASKALGEGLAALAEGGPIAVFGLGTELRSLGQATGGRAARDLGRRFFAEARAAGLRGTLWRLSEHCQRARDLHPEARSILVLSDGRLDPAALEATATALRAAGIGFAIEATPYAPAVDLRLELAGPLPELRPGRRVDLLLRVASTAPNPRRVVLDVQGERLEILCPAAGEELIRVALTPTEGPVRISFLAVDGANDDPTNDALELPILREGPRQILLIGATAEALREAFSADDLSVSVAKEWPAAALIAATDLIVLAEPNLSDARFRQDSRALQRAVTEEGVGLLILGGPRAFRAGGYASSPIEDLSPLSSRPASATEWHVLLDTSGSMAASDRLERARVALATLAAGLPPRTKVQVWPFAESLLAPIPAEPIAAEAFGQALAAEGKGFVANGATNLVQALEGLLQALPPGEAASRGLLVLSDFGDPTLAPSPRVGALRAALKERFQGVQVGTVLDPKAGTLVQAELLFDRVVQADEGLVPELLLKSAAEDPFVQKETALDRSVGDDEVALLVPGPVRAYCRTVLGEGAFCRLWTEGREPLLASAWRGAGRAAALALWPHLDPAARPLLRPLARETARKPLRVRAEQRGEALWITLPEGSPLAGAEQLFAAAEGEPALALHEVQPRRYRGLGFAGPLVGLRVGLSPERLDTPVMPENAEDPEFRPVLRPRSLVETPETAVERQRGPFFWLALAFVLAALALPSQRRGPG